MSKKIQTQRPQTKRILKRRLNNLNKQYLVLNNNLYEWKKADDVQQSQMKSYDQSMKNLLPYFPAVFEKKNPNVKMILENKRLKILYNQIEVNQQIQLNKEARLQIIQQLQQTFRPYKQFIYTHEKDKQQIKQMLKEESLKVSQ